MTPKSSLSSSSPEPIIEIENLVTKFGDNLIHDGLNLKIFKGEIMGIIGGSGSGKSVLLRTILGLNRPCGGYVKILGKDIYQSSNSDKKKVDASCGVLFQKGALYTSLTVQENILVPLKEIAKINPPLADSIVALKLGMVGLPLETALQYPSELSGGMTKRVALARALALDPRILFLDEPTSGLDPISAEAFDTLLKKLHAHLGFTVFMITHDLDTLRSVCTRIGVLLHKKLFCGTFEELKKIEDPWIHDYFHGRRARKIFGNGF